MRIITAFVLCLIAFSAFAIDMAGSHGHLMFRPHMTEDWIIWGIIVCSLSSAILLIVYEFKSYNRK